MNTQTTNERDRQPLSTVSRWTAAMAIGLILLSGAAQASKLEVIDQDGEWTFTFKAGRLECAKLPMKVTLPGFAEKVAIETDGEGLEGLVMKITGAKSREVLKVVREADVQRNGRYVPAWVGYQNISAMLQQRSAIRGKYDVAVLSSRKMEGKLTVDKAPYQGDVCSIDWPFAVSR